MSGWEKSTDLEKTLTVGIHGAPELKKEERRRYLGFFRERVLEAVTFSQLSGEEAKGKLVAAIMDPRANELVIHQRASGQAMQYIKTAQQRGLDFTITTDSEFIGDVAVVVVSNQAVDVEKVLSEE